MKPRITVFLLTLILILGLILRFYKLGQIPPGPEWDEASVGYNAYSIAQTGKDEWGTKWPLIFPAFGDYKNPLYIYLTAAVVKFFGLNIVTTRFINALTGTLMILVWYCIADLIFRNKKISLLTAFFLAVSPFGIFYSRIAGDGIMLSVFLIGLGILTELYYLKKPRLIFFIAAVIFLVLSMFSYNLARIVSPILLIAVFLVNFFSVKTKKIFFLLPLVIVLLSFFLIFKQSKISISSRLQYVGIFGREKGATLQINELREHDKNSVIAKLLHNKGTFFSLAVLKSYIAHFSTDFLVNFRDESNVSESHYPPLHLILLPFYYAGLILFIKSKKKSPGEILLLLLLALAPLPSVISEGPISSKRSLALIGAMEFITAYGIFNILKKRFLFQILISLFLFINLAGYFYFLFYTFPRDYGFIYARRENAICNVIVKQYNNYDYFIFSRKIDGVPYIFPLFCLSFPPQKLQQSRQFRQVAGWYYVDSFDQFIFPDELAPDKLKNLSGKNVLLFATADERNNLLSIIPPSLIQSLPLINDKRSLLYMFPVKL